MTATRPCPPKLPIMMPAEPPDLQAQYDVLAEAFAHAFELIAAQAKRIDALEQKIKPARTSVDAEPFAFVVPATRNAPARRTFDAAGFLAAIAERQRG